MGAGINRQDCGGRAKPVFKCNTKRILSIITRLSYGANPNTVITIFECGTGRFVGSYAL